MKFKVINIKLATFLELINIILGWEMQQTKRKLQNKFRSEKFFFQSSNFEHKYKFKFSKSRCKNII